MRRFVASAHARLAPAASAPPLARRLQYLETVIAPDRTEQAERVGGAPGRPTLSLFARFGPALREQAPLLRQLPPCLGRLGVSAPAVDAATRAFENASPHIHGRARTLAIFATDDCVRTLELGDDPAVVEPRLEARWGRPWIAPALRSLDCTGRWAVVYLDREHWRLFEVSGGEIGELDSARGSRDCAVRFDRIVGQRVAEAMERCRIERLFVAGASDRARQLVAALPVRARTRMWDRALDPIVASALGNERLARVMPIIDALADAASARRCSRRR